MLAVGDCAHAQLVALVTIARPRPIAFHVPKETWHLFDWSDDERLPLLQAKSWQRTNTQTSLAALATACGTGQRSHTLEKSLNFCSFYCCIRDIDGANEIYEN
jgi:hypothetical protein